MPPLTFSQYFTDTLGRTAFLPFSNSMCLAREEILLNALELQISVPGKGGFEKNFQHCF